MKKLELHWKILIGMVLGLVFGFVMLQIGGGKEFTDDWIKPLGTIFVNLLKLIAIPLILASLIKGISDLKDMRFCLSLSLFFSPLMYFSLSIVLRAEIFLSKQNILVLPFSILFACIAT